jgi:CBS domain-containing protein/mannitol/fructose-specific phosphotransferase system IIA component (Ntr-type)
MDLLELLPPEHVLVPLRAPDLPTAVETLARRLEETGAARPSEALGERLRTEPLRDARGLTTGAVLSTFRTTAVDSVTLAVGISPDTLDAGDDTPADGGPRVVALILAPPEPGSLYLRTVSTVTRLLESPGTVDALVEQVEPDGVLSLPQLQGARIQPSLTVKDIMVRRIYSVSPDASVRRALDLMLRRNLRAVPVVGDKGEVLGMVTDADIMRTLLPKIPRAGVDQAEARDEPGDQPVRDIMTRSVLCVSDDLGVNEVASMMINKDVRQVPVVSAGSISGLVSRGDIIRKLFGRG